MKCPFSGLHALSSYLPAQADIIFDEHFITELDAMTSATSTLKQGLPTSGAPRVARQLLLHLILHVTSSYRDQDKMLCARAIFMYERCVAAADTLLHVAPTMLGRSGPTRAKERAEGVDHIGFSQERSR